MKHPTKSAFLALERIQDIITKTSSNLTFTEISEFAVAVYEIKALITALDEHQNNEANSNLSRAKYRKFIVVTKDNHRFAMKKWIDDQPSLKKYKSKISHEISRVLVNNHNFRKVINYETNEVLHYQP